MTTDTATPVLVEDPALNQRWSSLAFWGMVIFVVGYCLVLLGAFTVQFVGHEYPCPLCMLQRYGMILATIPILWIVADALRGTLSRGRYCAGLGMAIIASVAGGTESTRQILLHIAKKGDPGYGSAVLGLHLYTWALITFVIVIVFCGVALMCSSAVVPLAPRSDGLRVLARCALWLFLGVIVLNVIAIIFLEGFSWILPDDPTHYRLLQELGFH